MTDFKAAKNQVLKLTDSGDQERDVSSQVLSSKWDLKGQGLIDVTTALQTGHKWSSDELENCAFTVEFMFDPTSNYIWDVLKGLRNLGVAKAFVFGPYGSTDTYAKVSGNCLLEDFSLDASVGDMVKISAAFKIDGATSLDVFP